MTATLTISDAARASGVSAHTLRYYERAGLLDPIDRAAGGHRRYAEEDLVRIQFLSKLRSTGMPIRQIRAYADLMRAATRHTRPGWHCCRNTARRFAPGLPRRSATSS